MKKQIGEQITLFVCAVVVARPNSSHIMVVAFAPLASVWPWPRCVEVR